MRRALDVVVDTCRDPRLREALRSISCDIESGSELSTAMSRRPKEFSPLFVAMVRAGELGGALEDVLERLASLLERASAIRKRVRSAMAYPSIVAGAALALVLFLIGSTVPAFAAMFVEMHVSLPMTTRILIAAGAVLRSPLTWIALALIVLGAIGAVGAARRAEPVAERLDRLVLSMPLFGNILGKAVLARFSRTLGTLLRSGVPLLVALDAAHDVVGNASYAREIRNLDESLREGETIVAALGRNSLFEPLILQLIRVGEETGTLDTMLLRTAEYYELDVETAVTTLSGIIEPALVIVLGALVGLIVASILIPLYSMIGSIK